MNTLVEIMGRRYSVDLSKPLDISLPLNEGDSNPNCYFADPIVFETIVSGDFVGSVERGGSVNYQKLIITPHGNGTHTECFGHISTDRSATINQCLRQFHFAAQLITVQPEVMKDGDRVITEKAFFDQELFSGIKALVIRTAPNDPDKKVARYSGTNPAYIAPGVIQKIAEAGVEHLLVDLPSIDREVDGGRLSSHKAFWNYPEAPRRNASVTELIYVPDMIEDDLYLLNLQITSLEMDASPSKPLLFKLEEVS